MDDYTRYIILSHIYWSENEITVEKLKEVASEIKGKDCKSSAKSGLI
jgi:hypothetical protein